MMDTSRSLFLHVSEGVTITLDTWRGSGSQNQTRTIGGESGFFILAETVEGLTFYGHFIVKRTQVRED